MSSEGGLAARRHRAYNETRAVNPSRSRGNIAQSRCPTVQYPCSLEPEDECTLQEPCRTHLRSGEVCSTLQFTHCTALLPSYLPCLLQFVAARTVTAHTVPGISVVSLNTISYMDSRLVCISLSRRQIYALCMQSHAMGPDANLSSSLRSQAAVLKLLATRGQATQ